MAGYIDVPGSGRLRTTTAGDVSKALEVRASAVVPAPRALTASAAKVTRRSKSETQKRWSLGWQEQALFMYDAIGELRFASHFIARMLSRVRYFPAMLGPDGKLEEITSGPPVDLLNQIQDPGGGRSGLQYRYGLLQFITGEGVLFGYDLEERQKWKFLWREEVRIEDSGLAVRLNVDREPTDEVGVAYKMWTPSPKHSDEPDSPTRAILDICEELLVLTASVRSTAVSRMTNGILLIPSNLSPNPSGVLGDEDPENNIFLADMVEHISHQIENPGSAEAKVPFVLEGDDEILPVVRWLQTHDSQNDYLERELRKEAVHRMALGLDMPPEALLGMTDANHWTAKQVMHDMWRSHGVPKSEQFADDLSEAYLRPALEEMEFPEWEQVVIGQDDSQVVISPDRTEDALKAHSDGLINGETAREALGWEESAKMEGEELERWTAIKMREPLLLPGESTLQLPARGPDPSSNGTGDAADGPPEPTGNRSGSRQESRTASAYILGAADLALARCRELAGIRIRHKCKDCAEGHPDAVVASVLGPAEVTSPLKLVQGGTDGFRSFLVEKDIEQTQAASLCQMIEVYAAKTLFEPKQPELPSGFMAQVEKAKEISLAIA